MIGVLLAVWVWVVLFCGLMLVRNEIVFRCRNRANNVASARAQRRIDNKEFGVWLREWEAYERAEYGRQLWDFRKWTFRQFFPEYADD